MRKTHSHIVFKLFGGLLLLLFATFLRTTSAKLIIIEGAQRLDSSDEDINYPDNEETLDVLWLFNHSIRLHFDKFHVDGHNGDFLLVSDQPLLDSGHFKELDPLDESYAYSLAESIVTDQGLLLSWKVKKTIEAVNERGTFVLFHSEAKNPAAGARYEGLGFDIPVVDYDSAITTTPPTTPDPFVTPKPGQKSPYIRQFLNCMTPEEFSKNLNDFKELIARIATEHCSETNIPKCLDKGNITKEEVNIPASNAGEYAGLHYCDKNWPNYDTCVEVFFAVLRMDNDGNYILSGDNLNSMWTRKEEILVENGYCPFDPPRAKSDMNTLIYIAYFLGIILSLTAILGIAWISNARATLLNYRRSFAKVEPVGSDPVERRTEIPDVDEKHRHYDDKNPIYFYIQKSNFSRDQLYPSGGYLGADEVDNDPVTPFKKRSTDNPTFQNVAADVYAYDNSGFEQEERPSTFLTSDAGPLYIRPHQASVSEI